MKRLVHASLIVLTLVIGAAAAAIIVTQTAWFRDWLRGYIVREANQYLNGTVSIERLGGNLFFGVEMENIGVSMDGTEVVAVKDLGLDYNVFELISRGLSVDNIRVNKPVIYLQRDGGTWSISRLIKKQAQEADRFGPDKPMAVDRVGITDGSVVFEQPVATSGVNVPSRFDHLDAQLSFKYEPVRYSIEISQVTFRGSDPAIALNALSGGVAVKNDEIFFDKLQLRTAETSLSIDGAVQNYLTKPLFNLQVSSDKLSLPEMAKLVPAVAGVRLQPAFEVHVSGPQDQLGVEMNVRSDAGQLYGTLTADLEAPGQSVKGNVSIRHLNLAPILNRPSQKSDITGAATFDLEGPSLGDPSSLHGKVHVEAPRVVAAGYMAERVNADATIAGRQVALNGRASAYGANATSSGRVTLPKGNEPLAYDLHGQARHLDLRRLPASLNVPPAATEVNAEYHVTGQIASDVGPPKGGPHVRTGVGSGFNRTSIDLNFLDSTVAGTRVAAGSTASVSFARGTTRYSADMTVADLNLQEIGREFNVKALADDRYKSLINGHLAAQGQGTKLEDLDVAASGKLSDSTVLGGKIPTLDFDATVARNTAHVKATGRAAGFDPAAVSGKPAAKGDVSGMLDVDATLTNLSRGVTPDNVEGTARIHVEPSTIGGLAIASANIDADYHDSTGVIRTLDVKGRDLNVTASGTLALSDTGQSNLTFHADTPSLEEIGKLVDKPLAGIAKIDGTVTGNRTELQAAGDFIGSDIAYDKTSALTMNGKYTAKIPDLELEQANLVADTTATFVTIGGQNINEVQAKTEYANKQLNFDASAKQPQRSLGIAGSLLLHPDHQEVHLQQLDLQAQSTKWSLLPGGQPTIQYGSDTIRIENLVLASSNQQITAEGEYGGPGDTLHVTASNVDLASVDTMLLRQPQFTGHLDASASITSEPPPEPGVSATPHVRAEFAVNQGGFRQFRYETFKCTADYSGSGVDVDALLQQNAATWLTAKGYVPMALFKGETATGHGETTPAGDRIDLHIDSSPIDLGIVQGFTTELTGVSGTMQAKVDVTGSASDPHPTGAITFQNGAFTVAANGVPYTNLDGRIDLQPDRVHIDELKVLDNQKRPLTLSGDLAIHELELGNVNVALKAHDFKVIDNKMGNVRVDTDLHLAGELRQPRLEGTLAVTTGLLNLDEIVAQTSDSAYATKQTEYGNQPAGAQTPKPSAYEAMQIDVRVTVPDDLVLRASDLQTSGSPIGLGSLNVTLGGSLYASKVPYDQARLYGTVNTVRGLYNFQGRRFDILRDGTVRFEGLDQLDPALDIRTERVIQAVTARVNVRGTMSMPEIELSSVPPLEEADILALIVFNQPINQLGEGQQISIAQRAQALATGTAAGELARSIGNALNVDLFEINTAPDSGAAAQVTVGQQIGQNVYVKVEQGIGDQSTTNVVFEYELARWLRLRTNMLQGASTQQQIFRRAQGSGADLLFLFSY